VPKNISDFRAVYERADELTQEVQLFRNKASWPALLELRNAGQQLLRAIDDQGVVVNQHELDEAISHTQRACYEATEAGIMFELAIIKKFKNDYSKTVVADIIPDYVARLRRSDEALEAVKRGRQAGFNRDADHHDRIDLFRELREFCRDLDAGREEVNKKVRQAKVALALVLLGLAITVFFGWPAFKDATWPLQAQAAPPGSSLHSN
jgi:hypothetical protein